MPDFETADGFSTWMFEQIAGLRERQNLEVRELIRSSARQNQGLALQICELELVHAYKLSDLVAPGRVLVNRVECDNSHVKPPEGG